MKRKQKEVKENGSADCKTDGLQSAAPLASEIRVSLYFDAFQSYEIVSENNLSLTEIAATTNVFRKYIIT